MAKKYIFYANGIDLAQCPITQNEVGVYYWNGSGYYKPVLSAFDNAILPIGYKRYANGSHLEYVNNAFRHPFDISIIAGASITSNVDVKILSATQADGSWVKTVISGTNINPAFVHCYDWATIGSTVKAGGIICKVAPTSVTKFSPHLHFDIWGSYLARDLILTGDVIMADVFKIGDFVTFTGNMNLRAGAGDGFNTSAGIPAGAIGKIKDGPRTSQNRLFYGKGSTSNVNDSYTWFDIQFLDKSGWVAQTTRFVKSNSVNITNTDGTLPTPPVVIPSTPPATPSALELAQKEVKTLSEKIGVLEATIEGLNTKVTNLESSAKIVLDEKNKYKNAIISVVESTENLKILAKE